MDMDRFDVLAARLTTHLSRRQGLGLIGLLGLAGMASAADADAGKKRKKRRRKKPPKPQAPGGPVGPAGPVARADASCIGTDTNTQVGATDDRVAQTFRAVRTGQLTSASVFLALNAATIDIDVEIWSVNQQNLPQTVLAGATLARVPAITPGANQRLTATFATPAAVIAGTRYALVVTKPRPAGFTASITNPCADGMVLTMDLLGGPFVPYTPADMHFETVVVS
jgi:hypothetical protein